MEGLFDLGEAKGKKTEESKGERDGKEAEDQEGMYPGGDEAEKDGEEDGKDEGKNEKSLGEQGGRGRLISTSN